MTVQGPVKKYQPDEISHRGEGGAHTKSIHGVPPQARGRRLTRPGRVAWGEGFVPSTAPAVPSHRTPCPSCPRSGVHLPAAGSPLFPLRISGHVRSGWWLTDQLVRSLQHN